VRVAPAAAMLLALCAGAALADESRIQLEMRIKLAARLFADGPSTQRIAASGNVQAASHLDEARLHQSLAEDAVQRGDLATARREVDDALRLVGLARRLVPDSGAQQAVARQRHGQMLASLDKLIESWRERLPPGEATDGDLYAALGLIETARYFGGAGRHIEGVFTLEAAERHVLAGMNRALQGRDIDYTQRAATPQQEFDLELKRHAALAELLPLAVGELKPRGDAAALIERYSDTSRSLRAQAQDKAQGGDLAAALAQLRNAMLYLQRALQAAGVSTPQATGSTP
jgi:hypothetical protein